jgi:aconitate hydratase
MKIDISQRLMTPAGAQTFFSLPRLRELGVGAKIDRLPVCIRVLLESLARNVDGRRIRDDDVEALARWEPNGSRTRELPFIAGRVLLQDFTGVPVLVDLAAIRSAVAKNGGDPSVVRPEVPLDLVVDHSVQVDFSASRDALDLNTKLEITRNRERYRFLKWGMSAFKGLRIFPPGFGICHQVNLEYLARGVLTRNGRCFFDTVIGTDSHTTMINGLGIVGWGVGGIEAEAAMLGEPLSLLEPDVVGVCFTGRLRPGVTATDLVLRVTEMLRKAKVVGKLVEFHGDGAATLSVPDRATVANMAPEYGATIGLFPADEESCRYLEATGRSKEDADLFRRYHQAQALFGVPLRGACDYTTLLELDLAEVEPSISGPQRPQDRIALPSVKEKFLELLVQKDGGGYGKTKEQIGERFTSVMGADREPRSGGGDQDSDRIPDSRKQTNPVTEREMMDNRPTPNRVGVTAKPVAEVEIGHGSVVIAAITSCTNTSNPRVMLAAGLLAKKAVERGLKVPRWVKTSFAPGSRAVSEYLTKTGLQQYLDALGFQVVGYGCTTCIGNSGPLDPALERTILDRDLISASVLSGNRNFEARIHQSVRANFLMSPPLVVAHALAGRIDIDLSRDAVGTNDLGPVYLRDLWPSTEEIDPLLPAAFQPDEYRAIYDAFADKNPLFNAIEAAAGVVYPWDSSSTYILEPPYFDQSMKSAAAGDLRGARALAIFGDSVTTDHISPAGAIKPESPAGKYLSDRGVKPEDFNSYGSRRGNHEVMVRGTFANIRIKNRMVPGVEGGVTIHQPSGERTTIFEAAERYQTESVPLIVFAGKEYGTGSSRDWAAKGTRLLGVRAVVAVSFERIHRSNLIGMGVLPCQLAEEVDPERLRLDGGETFDLLGIGGTLAPRQEASLVIHRPNGEQVVPVTVRIDAPIEVEYYRAGGILPFVFGELFREVT